MTVSAAARAEALRWLRDQVKRQRGGYFDVILAMLEEAGIVTRPPRNEARELARIAIDHPELAMDSPQIRRLGRELDASLAREQTERERAERAEAALAWLYKNDSYGSVARACDEHADQSGALLGRVRLSAREPGKETPS